MSTKLQFYSEFADRTARQITGSYRAWTSFLATAARLYKYPYNEQLMIYAQRPNATACAEYDFWKERMGRYVQRGSTGIALIDTSGYQPRLRYVFDVADTAPRDAARSFTLWEMRAEHEAAVSAMLTEQYDIPQDGGIIAQFERIADKLALEYWTEQKRDICDIVADSFLNGYDEDNIRMAFKTAASTSITYALMARCGFSPDGYFEPEDFMPVFDFNTPAAVSALGTAVSEISQRVLRQIEITVKRQERERRAERTEEHGEQPDLQDQRRISDSRSEPAREPAEPAARQIRTDAPDVSQGASPDPLEPDDPDGNAVSAPAGDRRSGEPEVGADDAEPDEVGRRDGGAESSRPIEVDRSDEHLQGASRGSDPRGTDLRVTEPVQGEQISFMLEAENAQTSSASSLSIPSELIDHVLRLGGNSDDTRMVLAAAFQKEKSAEEITEILRQEFHGGNGFKLDGADYSAWYADDGIHLAAGREAERVEAAQIISWQDAAARVAQLVESGEYATNVEIAEAYKHERDLLAEALLHLRGDLSDDARKQGDLSCLQEYGGSFPKALEKLSEALKDPVFQQNLSDEYAAFWTAYELDKNLLRFHYHKLREIWHRLKDLRLPRYELSDGMTEVSSAVQYITEDEISHTLMRGSGFAEGKSRIYAYFTDTHTEKEQADFLKKEYGVGGRTHAVSGASSSYEGSEPKGITLRKADCADVEMRWNRVAARISDLIRQNRYLTPEERAAYDEALAQDTVRNTAYDGYNAVKEAHPDDIVLYQVGDFFELYGEDARAVADDLSLELTRRNLEGVGRVTMCGFPANELEKYVEKLREKHDVTISRIGDSSHEHTAYTLPSIDHEAEKAINAYEAEFGADGTRVFRDPAAEQPPQATVEDHLERYRPIVIAAVSEDIAYRNACGHSDRENAEIECNAAVRRAILDSKDMELIRLFSDVPEFRNRLHQEVFDGTYERLHDLLRPLSQDDIDDALRAWNGNIGSKHAVVRYMEQHGREKETAAWLAHEYGGNENNNLFIVRAGSPETVELTWPKVQRRLAQLIREDQFLTEQEKPALEQSPDYRLLDRLRADCEYFLGAGGRAEKHLWAGSVYEQIVKMRELYDALPQKPEWLTEEMIDDYADRMAPQFQVVAYHRLVNGFDEKQDYQTLEEAEKAAQSYADGTMESGGFAYDGAAVYDLREDRYCSIFGDYPDERAQAQVSAPKAATKEPPEQPMSEITQAVQNLVGQRVEIDGTLYHVDSADETVAHLSAVPSSSESNHEPEHRTEPVSTVLTRIADQGRELAPNVSAYQALRTEHPEMLIGVRVGERLLFYGGDAERAASALKRRLLQRDIPGMGETAVTGYDFDQWVSAAKRLLEHGHSFVFVQPDETGGYEIFNEADAKDYIPIGMELEIDGRKFVIDSVNFGADEVSLQDVTFQSHIGYPIFRTEHVAFVRSFVEEQQKPLSYTIQPVEVIPAEQNHLPYDVVIQTLRTESLEPVISAPEPEQMPQADAQTVPPQGNTPPAQNFRITDDLLGVGGAKAKFHRNMDAINLLKELEFDNRQATPEEQDVLSKYVGWGGLADAFDESKDNWKDEFAELYATLTPEEYAAARASTLNAHYTSPTVIKAIYETVGNMGFRTGNILEPSMGVGNFFGCLPETMQGSKLYGVELDSITGRIAKQLYPNANITVAGFETTDRRDFYDLAIGNVPFGQYQVNDRAYNKLGFSIHNYFFAKALDQVRPGGIVAFVTSRYTMDSKDDRARRYIAERAELLGAIRLPNNAFKANAGTDVVSDILFLQKRDRPLDLEPAWAKVGENADGFAINRYFIDHPEMILGRQSSESTQYGKQDFTVEPIEGLELADQLHDAVKYIRGTYQVAALPALGEEASIQETIPADPNVKNFSYAVVRGEVYYRENSIMVKPGLNATAKERVKGMVELRDCVQKLIAQQMDSFVSDETIQQTQRELDALYDSFTAKYGLINSRANSLAFSDDSSYYLLCSLEILNENRELERKADIFTKRTIKPHEVVTSVDTASEALALSISEKACVDMDYMAQLSGKSQEELIDELNGVIFFDPVEREWQTADEYLSGNVREKLRIARSYAAPGFPKDGPADYSVNVAALEQAQPKDLDASEIEVRLGATWIDEDYIQQFMEQTFKPPYSRKTPIQVSYSPSTAEWNISGKFIPSTQDVNAYMTYGTERANAYRILEDTLNLRDVRIYDTTYENGVEKRVLNQKETTLAQQKQQTIKDAFQDWIWKDPIRRQTLVQQYNEKFNSTRPREYDGSHIRFSGMNPEITLREHQKNAIAHILYGGNTLLAHEVGAGKTFEMVAAEMESKRLGLCQKAMFVVPNHLTEQWASEFLRLYPSANILVTTKKDFETRNRKKFCARIATGDYDAVIIGHSQFEKIPISKERQERLLQEQIWEIEDGIRELQAANAERFTIKSLEKTKKSLEAKLKKLQDTSRKDDVITFEQLGIDRLYVDEAHSYKNLFLYTKMRNVAGLSATDAQKSSDMLLKCRYIDEITGGKGVVFATGTPVSNSMTELFTMMRYLQHDTLRERDLTHFDCWASTFGETTTAIELAPEGTGYRARTRFAKFFNLPELMNLFKEAADIKTADQLHLPTPTPVYHTEVSQPTQVQQGMVQELSKRAAEVHSGKVDAKKDNMLKITSDGRKLGLDQRIINPNLPDDPCSKVNRCVDNFFRIWQDGQADKLTQLVFCDLSTPKASPAKAKGKTLDNPELRALETQLAKDGVEPDTPFSVYDDIRGKLVAMGIPREQIAFIHEANTEIRKKELFSKVRSGQVRVLMGSTFKMGAGMNVQDRLIALHDLDCPWRPGDLEQRSGRIIRQGNRNKEVHIYRYVTEGTFDAYLWQTIENKQKFISQIMTSKSPVRSCEDIDETALSYAEIKALCAGDERIKEKMDLDVDVARLKLMRANHQSQQYRLEDNLLRKFPEQIDEAKNMIAGLETDIQTLAAHPHPADGFAGMEVKGDNLTDKDNAGAALLEACKEVKDLEPVSVGSYRGFQMALTLENYGQDYILTLKGQMSHRVELGKDARGNLVRIDNALNAISERVTSQKAYLDNLYAQVKEAKAALGKPFPQEEELRKKSARLAELNAELNIDDKTPMERLAGDDDAVAKSARPSILQKLRSALPEQPNLKPKQKEMEAAL